MGLSKKSTKRPNYLKDYITNVGVTNSEPSRSLSKTTAEVLVLSFMVYFYLVMSFYKIEAND